MPKVRNSQAIRKRIELWIVGELLKEGIDVYVPIVDDKGIDAVIRKQNGQYLEMQIKGTS